MAAVRFYTTEQLGPKQDLTPDGYLICYDVPLSRTGVQTYEAGEVPIEPGPDGIIRIDRDPDEVFKTEAIASANGKPVTIDHPPVDVTPDNWRELAMGYLIDPRRGQGAFDDVMLGDLFITCPKTIELIRTRRLREISLGYDADYEEIAPGRGRQTQILVNHIALLEPGRGRCGPRCSIGDHLPTCELVRDAEQKRDKIGRFAAKYGPGGSHEHRMHELSSRALETEYEKAHAYTSNTGSALIAAGRGTEKYSETREKAKQGDPLAQAHVNSSNEHFALGAHRRYRQTHGEKFVREQGRRELERRRTLEDSISDMSNRSAISNHDEAPSLIRQRRPIIHVHL